MGLFCCLQGTTWHYRKAVPDALRPYLGKREIKKTLRTGNKLEARRRSLLVGDKVEQAIIQARAIAMSTELSEAEKEDIIKGLFNFILKIQDSHLDSAGDLPSYFDLDFPVHRKVAQAIGVPVETDIQQLRNIEESQLNNSLDEHKNRDFESLKNLVQGSVLFNNQEFPKDALSGSFLNALSIARIEAYKLIHARTQGENPPIPERYKLADHSIPTPVAPHGLNAAIPQALVKIPSKPLAEVIEEHAKDRLAIGRWKDKTERENRALYQNFLDYAGPEITCGEIDYHLVSQFREALKKLPANRNKLKKYRNKTIFELLEMNVDKPMSTTTVNKNLNRLSTLLNFAVKLDYMAKNPAQGMEITTTEKASEQREAFTTNDLQKLFSSPQYHEDTFKHPFMFWAVPIALFTGMRQNEIAQLHLTDIYEKDGIWVIDVNENTKSKKLKTKSARRLVPLHPFLANDLNLPAYVESLREQGHERLFPEIEYHRDGYGQKVSRWFNGHGDGKSTGYKKSCGISGKGKVFHSFRHTIIDHLKQKRVDDHLLHQFDGHAFKSQTLGRYGKDYNHDLMYKKIVQKITFDKELSLDHLLKSKYVLD